MNHRVGQKPVNGLSNNTNKTNHRKRRVKMLILSIEILVGIIFLYFSIVTFFSGFKVPVQRLEKTGQPFVKPDAKPQG